jgi:hypothetical protein
MTRALPVTGLRATGRLDENARRILAVRLAEFYGYTPVVHDEFAIEALHDLRIATKRLRYTLELFRSLFGESGEVNIGRMKLLQEALGNIHDVDVRIEMIGQDILALAAEQLAELNAQLAVAPASGHRAILTSTLRPPPDDPRRGLYALLSQQALDRHRHYQEFLHHWLQFESEGMRADLVTLTWSPDTNQGEA